MKNSSKSAISCLLQTSRFHQRALSENSLRYLNKDSTTTNANLSEKIDSFPSRSPKQFLVQSLKSARHLWHGPVMHDMCDKIKPKIIDAFDIMNHGHHVGVDECYIHDLKAHDTVKLYTKGLVFCTGVVMIGVEKIAMLHIHKEAEKLLGEAFEKTNPTQVFIYQSMPLNHHFSNAETLDLYAQTMRHLNDLKSHIKASEKNCEFIKHTYGEQPGFGGHYPALFCKKNNNQRDASVIPLDDTNMKLLDRMEYENFLNINKGR